MLRHKCCTLSFTLLALGLAIGARPLPGQTMSFFQQFTTPGMDQAAAAVSADGSGIYVVWNETGSQGGQGAVRKYDSRGNELWTRQLLPAVSGNVVGSVSTAADGTGLYVVAAGSGRAFVRKYSADGDELWTRELESPRGLAVDSTGVYLVGSDPVDRSLLLRKYSADGAELWTRRTPAALLGPLGGLAADATGVYVLEVRSGPAGVVRKYDPRGSELWARQLDFQPRGAAAGHPSGLFVIGEDNSLHRYDADGNQVWGRQVATPSSAGFTRVAADAAGVYVAGFLPTRLLAPWNALPGQCRSGSGGDSFVRSYDSNGAGLWTREFGTSYDTRAGGVASDAGGVYVFGTAYRPAPGKREWESSAFLAKFEKAPVRVAASRPYIFPDCVVSAASYIGGGVAPGEMVTLFGSAMGPPDLVPLRLTEDRRLATTLAGTRILFNGVPAPLLYVSDKQSSAIVPYAVAGRTSVNVQVEYAGVRSDALTVPLLPSRPGIFSLDGSGRGQGAILNEDGTVNSPSNPARRGSIITIFGTGEGAVAPFVADGLILSDIVPRSTLPVSVSFDFYPYTDSDDQDIPGEVLYAGGVSGSVPGLLQINVRVPANAGVTGDAIPFAVTIGSESTVFQVTMALR